MEDLSQHMLDLAFNSLEAGCTDLQICIREDLKSNILEFMVRDNGHGIDRGDMEKVLDPFFTTKEKARVGLGISLLKEAVERCDGIFKIDSLPRVGTCVYAVFTRDHVDRAPLGDMTGTIISLITAGGDMEMVYHHEFNRRQFYFSTEELKLSLEGISIQTTAVLVWLEEYLSKEIKALRRGKNEKFGRAG
ncbi:MAG: ATP-binding protein [Firmicutes bacterium]|nr:ATP-binding protein [Bacillota bacterium]